MIHPKALALMTLGGVGFLGFASGAFGTFSSTLLSGYNCSAYGFIVGFGYGYDCTQNPIVTVTGGSLGSVSTISGTTTAADSVTIGTGTNVVFNPTGSVKVTIPSSTVITPVGAATFDTTALSVASTSVNTGLGTNEESVGAVDFGVGGGVGLNFSIPIRIDIPVPGYTNSTISIKVKHAGSSTYTTDGLTNDANTTCTNGVPGVASSIASVSSQVATIYTCQASTFTTYKVISANVGGGGGGGGSSSYTPTLTYTSAIIPVVVPTTVPDTLNSASNSSKARLQALRERLKLLRAQRAKSKIKSEGMLSVAPQEESTSDLAQEDSTYKAYVNVPRLSMWKKASMVNSKFLGYLYRNQEVTVMRVEGEWAQIKTKYYVGWVIESRLIKK